MRGAVDESLNTEEKGMSDINIFGNSASGRWNV
jgi:hypothetical protein